MDRIKWVDYAKGLSIILVVIYHSTNTAGVDSLLYKDSVGFFNDIFNRIRMPLFFFVSGLFIKKAVNMKKSGFYEFKALHLLYLYVIWSVIRYATSTLPEVFLLGGDSSELLSIFTIFIAPPSTLWFIYALLIFIVVTRLTKNFTHIVFVASIVLFLTKSYLGIEGFLGDKLLAFYPFYILGFVSTNVTRAYFNRFKWYFPFAVLTYFSLLIGTLGSEFSQSRLGVLMFSLAGIIAGIMMAITFSRAKGFSWVEYIGRNTLPIYLMHFLPVNFLRLVLPKVMPDAPFLAHIITALLGITVPLAVMIFAKKLGVRGLFNVPFTLNSLRNRAPQENIKSAKGQT